MGKWEIGRAACIAQREHPYWHRDLMHTIPKSAQRKIQVSIFHAVVDEVIGARGGLWSELEALTSPTPKSGLSDKLAKFLKRRLKGE